jgi:hypothetical protein
MTPEGSNGVTARFGGKWNDIACYNSKAQAAWPAIPKNYICKRAVVAVFFVCSQSVGAFNLVYEQIEHIRIM